MHSFARFYRIVILVVFLANHILADDTNYTSVPQCAEECVIAAFTEGFASCPNVLDTTCTCADVPYQSFLTTCVTSNCTIKEQLIAKKMSSRQCGVPEKPPLVGVLSAMFCLFCIATLLMLLRVIVKLMGHGGGWGADDWLIVPAYMCLVIMCGVSIEITRIAFGHNMWDVSFSNITLSLELFWIADLAYTALISLTKLSMCFFFLRIFSHSRPFRRSVFAVVIVNAIVFLVFETIVAFQCRPVAAFWTSWDGEQTNYSCFHLYSFALGQGIVSIVMDIIMISLPIHETLKVKLSRKKKIGVVVMFAMGFAWTIIGIVRCIAVWNTRIITNLTVDMAPLGYWTDFEACIAVICACLPDSRFFFNRLVPKACGWSSTKGIKKSSSPYYFSDPPRRSARQKTARRAVGMISVTTDFEMKSVRPGSLEQLNSTLPVWEARYGGDGR